MESFKDLKKEISKLRKLKNTMRPGSKERLDLHRKIKELKQALSKKKEADKGKDPIIKEILRLDVLAKEIQLDKFTIEQLQKHLEKIKKVW